MSVQSKKDEMQKAATGMLPDATITLGYLEHYVDLIGKLVSVLAHKEESNLTDDEKKLLTSLDGFLTQSSIDFKDMTNPLQAYKIPKAIEAKQRTRMIQSMYLNAQIKEGIFGK